MSDRRNSQRRPELDELLGAYALDAVEPLERVEIEQYLDSTGDARDELDAMREAAAALALVVDDRESVAPALWERIASAAGVDAARAVAVDRPPPGGDVVALEGRRGRRARTARWLAVAAAMIVVVVVTAGIARRTTGGPTMSDSYRAAASAGREIMLASGTDARPMAHVALRPDGTGYVRNDGLHALPSGQVYQLWVVPAAGAAPVSLGVVAMHGQYTAVAVPGPFAALAISVEDAPGAVSPSTPVASGAA